MLGKKVCYKQTNLTVTLQLNVQLRFAQIESVMILAMLIERFTIEVKEEPQFINETFEQRKHRILKARAGVTVT